MQPEVLHVNISWVLFVVVTAIYLGASLRDLWTGHKGEASSVMILLVGAIGILFTRQAIQGGTATGAARLATAAAASVLIATLGRPTRMMSLPLAKGSEGRTRTRTDKRTLRYQIAFISIVCASVLVTSILWPTLYD